MAFEEERVQAIAERVAATSGLEVVEIELRGGGKNRMLRVFLDKPAGVTHEDCAHFSREFGRSLMLRTWFREVTCWKFLLPGSIAS